jgi:hypothetical protein
MSVVTGLRFASAPAEWHYHCTSDAVRTEAHPPQKATQSACCSSLALAHDPAPLQKRWLLQQPNYLKQSCDINFFQGPVAQQGIQERTRALKVSCNQCARHCAAIMRPLSCWCARRSFPSRSNIRHLSKTRPMHANRPHVHAVASTLHAWNACRQ